MNHRHTSKSDAELRHEITVMCAQVDKHLGNPAGTAERGVYFWWWPPENCRRTAVLTRLHADAVTLLCRVLADSEAAA